MGAIVGIDLSVQTLDLISFVDQLVVLGFILCYLISAHKTRSL